MSTAATLQMLATKQHSLGGPARPGLLQQKKCDCGSSTPSLTGECTECSSKKRLQTKLTIGASNDPLEQEADRVADQVMAMSAHSPVSHAPPRIQRYSSKAAEGSATAPVSVDRVLAGSGSALEPTLRHDMEQRFGHDFSRVRVHSDEKAEQSAREVGANAYTVGHNVVFGADRFAPGTHEGRRLIAHELTHVVQQSDPGRNHPDPADRHWRRFAISSSPSQTLARAPTDPVKTAQEVSKSHQVDLEHLRELLIILLRSLSPATQARIDRNSTVAVALVELIDEANNPFTTLVYATNSHANTPELRAAADRLNIEHVGGAVPRAEGRGEIGAPGDAEQLLSEAVSENEMKLLGKAVSRPPCKDCAAMIKDEEIVAVWLDPAARKSAFRAGRLHRKGSAGLQTALAELDQSRSPSLSAAGQEAETGLGVDAPVWATLNGLDVKELYKVFELMQDQGRLNDLEARARKARGIYNDRLLAVIAALDYKKQLQSSSPTDSALMGAHWAFRVASANLPPDQVQFLERALQPALRSIAKQKPPAKPQAKHPAKAEPMKGTVNPEKSTSTSFFEAIRTGLLVAGVAISGLLLLELAEALATALFVEVVIAAGAQALKGAAADRVKEVVVNEVKKRVALTPEQLARIGDAVLHELEPILDGAKLLAH